MRFRLIVAMAAVAGAGANVVGDGRLMAQDTPAELTGCLDVTVGAWVVETYVDRLHPRPGESEEWNPVPPRIMFAGPLERIPSNTRIVVPEGAPAMPAGYSTGWTGGRIEGDSLEVFFSSGYTGMRAKLGRSGDGWTGTMRSFTPTSFPTRFMPDRWAMSRVDCESPLPIPGGESAPLGQVVELEGGQVITLGEPLPEQLETVALPPFDWNRRWSTRVADMELTTARNAVGVVGRTRGLFGTTDSIQGPHRP